MCTRGSKSGRWKFHFIRLICSYPQGARSNTLAANAVEHRDGCSLLKTDTRQAFLYGEMEEGGKVYICPPDWWQELIPDGHVLLLLKKHV
jgi:hypothetical protein